MRLPVRRLRPDAIVPTRAYDGDAGLDLHAADAVTIAPGERATVPTGIAIELPRGHAALVLPRSGLAARHGIALVNSPGLIDSGYRGEIRVLLLNTDREAAFSCAAGSGSRSSWLSRWRPRSPSRWSSWAPARAATGLRLQRDRARGTRVSGPQEKPGAAPNL